MKVLHISQSDIVGGAARAAYRLHRAQCKFGIDSRMLVRGKKTDDYTVIGPDSKIEQALNLLRTQFGHQLNRLQKNENKNFHSGDWLPSCWAEKINMSDVDVVNLHWVAGETMSIEDIGRIKKPIVWTLHDMWPFCGTEHVTEYDQYARWKLGYRTDNRGPLDRGLDLDRLAWLRKKKAWQQVMHIVAPSRWMAECARDSALFQNQPVCVIPNVLDTSIYQPLNKMFCRNALGLPEDKKIILFGAMGGGKDYNKGYDLLINALTHLSTKIDVDEVVCVIFGQSEPEVKPDLPFSTQWVGHIHDDVTLALLYNSATVMVVPSRIENLPQTATEAQSCGVPVVAFNSTGIKDVITHLVNGYLASAYNIHEMSDGLKMILSDSDLCNILGENSRHLALERWSEHVGVQSYLRIYNECIK